MNRCELRTIWPGVYLCLPEIIPFSGIDCTLNSTLSLHNTLRLQNKLPGLILAMQVDSLIHINVKTCPKCPRYFFLKKNMNCTKPFLHLWNGVDWLLTPIKRRTIETAVWKGRRPIFKRFLCQLSLAFWMSIFYFSATCHELAHVCVSKAGFIVLIFTRECRWDLD